MTLTSNPGRFTRGKGKQAARSGRGAQPPARAPAPSEPTKMAEEQYTTEVYSILSSDKEKTVRQHLMRLQSHLSTDPKDFTPPIKLVKRNVYNRELQEEKEAAELAAKEALEAKARAEEGEQAKKEGEGGDKVKEEEEEEEETPAAQEDLSNIAPYGGATYNRQNLFQKKTRFVYANREVLNARRQKLRDGQPWMLVDDDRQNIFEGKIQAKQRPTYFLLVIEDGNFRVVQVAKQYRFMRQPSYKTLTAEEAEAAMAKRQKQQTHNRWIMRNRSQDATDDVDANETLRPEEASSRPSLSRKLITVDARDRDRGGDEYLDYEGLGTRSDDDEGEQEAEREDEDERARKDQWSREVHAADSAAYDIDDMELFGGAVELDEGVKAEEGGPDAHSKMEDTRDLRRLGVEVAMAGRDESDDEEDPYAKAAGVRLKEERAREREARRQEVLMMQPTPQPGEGGEDKEVAVKKEEDIEGGTQETSVKKTPGEQSPEATPMTSGEGPSHVSAHKRVHSDIEGGADKERKKKRDGPSGFKDPDANLITEADVIEVIQSAKLTPKEVVNRLRLKLQKDPRNKKQAYQIILQVASLQNGVLVLNKKP
ncbi:hypothetical protein BJ684DRAFT_20952 [Piptocephalis cylindrospora]|uniref:Transcription initiation factor IIF subunit alpha n=1 Tax=Piptocephalis cylindrospora TaxID=1907219 RepID=A0A4P9Y177_9FUNG|nr:hypothetical protein BJ684DRAFT_20952 [Piptocephalis cylindrospora]|eukprot:RKP12517.1 hypothetical protein BJ684DRAFT_20952 [Piptocephalis cylindrospora]